MLILAIFVAAGVIAYASSTALVRHDQRKIESMTYAELCVADEETGIPDNAYALEIHRRREVLVNHRSEWVN